MKRTTGCLTAILILFGIGLVIQIISPKRATSGSSLVNAQTVEAPTSLPPSGFSGEEWGSHPPHYLKLLLPTTSEGLSLYVSKHSARAFEGIPISEQDFQYVHNKLYGGDDYFDGGVTVWEKALSKLVKLYGLPTFRNDDLRIVRWKWKTEKVEVALSYQKSSGRTTLAYSDNDID